MKLIILSLTLISFLSTEVKGDSKDICRALVLSGGANKGSYEAGVLYGLNHLLNVSDVAYDVVSGISAGAINSGGIALWDPLDGKEMSEWLVQMWMNMTSDQVYENWPGGVEKGLLNQSGVINSEPLFKLMTNISQSFGEYKRNIVVGAVDINTGNFIVFSNNDTNFEDFPYRIVASASIPFVFPHRNLDNMTLVDGGVAYGTNLISAVQKCMEIVDDQSKIIMDIIICDNDKIDEINKTSDAIGNYLRFWNIRTYNNKIRNVEEFQRAYPNVNYRYFFIPSQPLVAAWQELSFDPEVIGPMVEIGKQDAEKMIKLGEGVAFKRFIEWSRDLDLQQQYPNLSSYLHEFQ